jgi:hypothetical protein
MPMKWVVDVCVGFIVVTERETDAHINLENQCKKHTCGPNSPPPQIPIASYHRGGLKVWLKHGQHFQ